MFLTSQFGTHGPKIEKFSVSPKVENLAFSLSLTIVLKDQNLCHVLGLLHIWPGHSWYPSSQQRRHEKVATWPRHNESCIAVGSPWFWARPIFMKGLQNADIPQNVFCEGARRSAIFEKTSVFFWEDRKGVGFFCHKRRQNKQGDSISASGASISASVPTKMWIRFQLCNIYIYINRGYNHIAWNLIWWAVLGIQDVMKQQEIRRNKEKKREIEEEETQNTTKTATILWRFLAAIFDYKIGELLRF